MNTGQTLRESQQKAPCGAENGVESKLNLAKCAPFTEVDTRAETVDKLDGCEQVIAKKYLAQLRVPPAQKFLNNSD